METALIDNELMHYWARLTMAQKESVLNVLKSFIAPEEATGHISMEQYNKELEEAMKRMDAGEFYTHEQVVEKSKTWLRGK